MKTRFLVALICLVAVRGNSVDEARGVLQRTIPDHAPAFHLFLDPALRRPCAAARRAPRHSECDRFSIAASGGYVFVNGTSGVALTAGAYWYIKNVANGIVTWGVNGTGDQLNLPTPLPPLGVGATVTVVDHARQEAARHVGETLVPWRYAWNVCTFGYSGAFWDWPRWRRELDWMALHGVNLPLAMVGQESAWVDVVRGLGGSLSDLETFFSGPAFLPWQRMGNVRGWGGPLSAAYVSQQRELQVKIVSAATAIGMTPVLPCFSGHVPAVMSKFFPTAKFVRSPAWNHFPVNMTSVYMVDPADPVFVEIGMRFTHAIVAAFGTSHYFSCDQFNEVDPTNSTPAYLAKASAAVIKVISMVDPEAVWVMQAWLFHSPYWHVEGRVKSYLSGAANDRMLILDLNSEAGALAPRYDQYFGKPWVWNMLHNYGGVRGVYGNLSRIASGPVEDFNTEGSTMCGIGYTPEAIEQNPVIYELLTDSFWAHRPIDTVAWLRRYVGQRYGMDSSASSFKISAAWRMWQKLLLATYSQPGEARSEIEHVPRGIQQPDFGWKNGDPTGMISAFDAVLVAGTPSTPQSRTRRPTRSLSLPGAALVPNPISNGPFQYDLVDVARQSATMFWSDMHRCFVNYLNTVPFKPAANWARPLRPLAHHMISVIGLIDDVLATNPNYLLGVWTESAGGRAATGEAWERDLFVYNAKNQVTLWGPDGQISDYAAKAWAGLYGTYYKQRWSRFMTSILAASSPSAWNPWEFSSSLLQFEKRWCNGSTRLPSKPSGRNGVTASAALHAAVVGSVSRYRQVHNISAGGGIGYYQPMWTRDTRQLALLCDLTPACEAFGSDGTLLSNIKQGHRSTPGVDMFVKKTDPTM